MAFANPYGIDISGPSSHIGESGNRVSWDPESQKYVPTESIDWTKYGLTEGGFWSKYSSWLIGGTVLILVIIVFSKYVK